MAAAQNPHRTCKLTEDQVREIRINRRGLSMRKQAEVYGVHIRTIEKIRAYLTWRDVL